jgi:pimeloyl-ACP methyl ester carboxylesterase
MRFSWKNFWARIFFVKSLDEKMPFATAPDGVRLYYESRGAGEPLLLIAGRNSDHHLWNLIRGDFTGRYRVIVCDLSGTGESDKPPAPRHFLNSSGVKWKLT